MDEKDIREMRHEIIELAISLENFLDEEIMTYFALDAWDASYHMQIERSREIFKEFCLNIGILRKIKMIKQIMKSFNEKPYEKFGADGKRFIEIRNIFAHTFYPEVEKELMPKMKIEIIKNQQKSWEEMFKDAKNLYAKIINELDSKFYEKDTRARRYRRFDEIQLKKIIENYEKIINENSKK
jgi:hypothetical protein